MSNRIPIEDGKRNVARCNIPQDFIEDPSFIAARYPLYIIEEAIEFKRTARAGSLDLKHFDLADSIQDQIQILFDAKCTQTGEFPRTESP